MTRRALSVMSAVIGAVVLSPIASFAAPARAAHATYDPAQGGPGQGASCAVQAQALRGAVESDYIGYRLALMNDPARGRVLTEAGERLMVEAASAPGDCRVALRRYIAAFDDPHLFLSDTPTDAGGLFDISPPPDLRERALAAAGRDAIFGLWSDGERDIAVVPGEGDESLAFVLSADGVEPRAAARFVRTSDGYDAVVRDAEGRAARYPARIQKAMLLHMPPLTWVRRAPVTPLEARLAGEGAPRGPGFAVLADGAVALSLPSFSPEHQPALEALLTAHGAEIAAAPVLIVDIRGNEGGSAGVGDLLAPYYLVEGRMEPPPSRRRAVVLASAGLIAHYERLAGYLQPGEYRDFVERLTLRMKAAPGRLIPYGVDERDWALMEAEPQAVALAAGPPHVAILTDEHVVSAGEAFLLTAGRSPKVTIFGRNSAGSIDYESVYMTAVRGDGFRLLLGLPSVAASDALPVGGLNAGGVPVDVEMDADAPDALERIAARYVSPPAR